jgi:hypothetical protein
VRTPEEARAYVRTLKAAGVDHIKVDLTITDDQLRAVIEESNAVGLRVLGHTQNIQKAVEWASNTWSTPTRWRERSLRRQGRRCQQGSSPEAVVDPKLFPPLIDYLVKQGVYVNPTLVLIWSASTPRGREFAAAHAQVANDPALAFVPADAKAAWVRPPGRPRDGYPHVAEFLRKYSEAGGKVLAATDTGCLCADCAGPEPPRRNADAGGHGHSTDEGHPGRHTVVGRSDWPGQGPWQPGAGQARDVTVIEGNPLVDFSATKRVRMVIKDGVVMDTSYDPKWVNPVPRPSAGGR